MQRTTPVTAYIGLGSNLGDRKGNIFSAVLLLSSIEGTTVVKMSSLIENPAIGGPTDSPAFLNSVVKIETTLSAHALMEHLLDIEQQLGRQHREKWSPREIDLDLLLYGDHILSSDSLVVPHPLMHERRFVLQPLAEIAPEAVHPTLQMTAAGLLENLK